jgi:hypothetical protein
MVFNATFNNVSVISWQSVLLVQETRVSGENDQSVASHWQTLSHNTALSTPEDLEKTTDPLQVTDKLYHIILYTSPWSRFELTTSVAIDTDCIGSCKPNYHAIMAMIAPNNDIYFWHWFFGKPCLQSYIHFCPVKMIWKHSKGFAYSIHFEKANLQKTNSMCFYSLFFSWDFLKKLFVRVISLEH